MDHRPFAACPPSRHQVGQWQLRLSRGVPQLQAAVYPAADGIARPGGRVAIFCRGLRAGAENGGILPGRFLINARICDKFFEDLRWRVPAPWVFSACLPCTFHASPQPGCREVGKVVILQTTDDIHQGVAFGFVRRDDPLPQLAPVQPSAGHCQIEPPGLSRA